MSPRYRARLRTCLITAAALLPLPAALGATLTWNNSTGDWQLGSNWAPAGPPGAADIAVINGGNSQLNAPATIAGYTQTAGTLSGTGTLAVSGASSWTAGTQTGAGTTQFGGALSLGGNGSKTISGGRTLDLQGSTTWGGNTANNNNVISFSNGTINNNGSFDDQNAFSTALSHFSGTNTFNNAGSYTKSGNSTTTIGIVFNNTGSLAINAGSMLLNGSTHSGPISIGTGASLEFRNGTNTLNGVTVSGNGTLVISTDNVGADGVPSINGGQVDTAFLLSGGPLYGTAHTINGTATWTGGSIRGDGAGDFEVTSFNNDLTISGAGTKGIYTGRTINLNAVTTWTGNTGANNNAISFSNGGTVNNNGTFDDNNGFNAFIEHSVGGPHNFNNAGTYNKNGNSVTTVDGGVAFNNAGTVNINAGTFLPSGGSSTGSFVIAAGATLEFRNGNSTLNQATTSGAGLLLISSDNVGADAIVTVNGGSHTTAFTLSGSIMNGADHSFQGPVSWTGGAIAGDGTGGFESTTFTNDVSISGAATKTLQAGRTLNLQGTTTWSGNTANNNNAIRFWNGATLNNNGTFNDDNSFNAFVEHNVGGPHNFNNVGTYNKNGSSTTLFDLGVTLNNTGQFNVNAGTVQVVSAFDNQGSISTADATTFATTSTSVDLQNHGILQGTGTYDPAAGRAVINAGEVRPGTATTVGSLTMAGNFTQGTAGLFQVNLASLTTFDSMDVLGNLALAGVLQVTSLGGYNPVLGDSFTIITFDDGVVDATDLAGSFGSIAAVGFDPALLFEVLYLDHSVVLTVAAVPLPPAWPLAGTALAALLLRARRRRG